MEHRNCKAAAQLYSGEGLLVAQTGSSPTSSHAVFAEIDYELPRKVHYGIEQMNHKVWILFTLVFICFVGSFIVWTAGSQLTNPVPVVFKKIPSNASTVTFESKSGSSISGWTLTASNPSAIAVLMHGIRSNRAQMIDRAEHLKEMGISSLVFDFQAHGESPGEIITLGHLESYDAQAAVRFMQSLHPNLPTIVIGVSMGGAASVLASPALDVNVLILESVYSDVETAISNRLKARIPGGQYLTPLLTLQIKPRAGIEASKLSPVLEAHRVKAATLVLSGELDVQTTVSDTSLLFESLPMPKQMEIIDGASHVDLERYDRDVYWNIVEPFLETHLSAGV